VTRIYAPFIHLRAGFFLDRSSVFEQLAPAIGAAQLIRGGIKSGTAPLDPLSQADRSIATAGNNMSYSCSFVAKTLPASLA
jgi:hypothetical protein